MNNKQTSAYIKGIFSIVIIFLFFGCYPILYDEYTIDNQSDYEINIFYKTTLNFDTTLTIEAQNSKVFYTTSGIGIPEDYNEYFLSTHLDSLSLFINDSASITKDYLKRESWEYSTIGKNTSNYKLVLTNEDIKTE